MEDKKIVCSNCGEEFIFTASEQKFYTEKGLYEPKKCKTCREAAKAEKNKNRSNNFYNRK